jgi:hypothetical protein
VCGDGEGEEGEEGVDDVSSNRDRQERDRGANIFGLVSECERTQVEDDIFSGVVESRGA